VRLDPPYLASLGLVLAIAWAGPLLPPASTVGNVTAADVALHLGYANLLVGERWLNPVYWTLAIELQWYLLAGVIYGAITSRRGWLRRITIVLLAAASFVPNLPHTPRSGMIFPFLGFFVMGVATFHRRTGKLGRAEMLLMIGAGAAVSTYRVGFVAALAAMGTALIIAEVDVRPRPLLWLGELSYSLYLVHVPVATPFIRYAIAHHVAPAGRVALLAAALAVSIVVAKGLASLIEEPSRRLAARIGYRGRRSSVAVRSGDRLTPVVALEVPT
jgi:peptidoglycan/LPS O-acetylase OafA/YrhL